MTRLFDYEFNGQDGVLVDLRFAGFQRENSEIRPAVDFCPDADPQSRSRRHLCVSDGLSRFLVKGDMPKLVKNAASGNIDRIPMDFADTTDVVVPVLFGGMLQAEASIFTLTELRS